MTEMERDIGLTQEQLEAWQVNTRVTDVRDRVADAWAAELNANSRAPSPVRRGKRSWRLAVMATVASIMLGAIGLFVALRPQPVQQSFLATSRQTIPLAGRGVAVLEAGSQATLTGTKGGDLSARQTDGNVFYRVDPGGSFVVETPAGNVSVTGTCFRVEVGMRTRDKVLVGGAIAAVTAAAVIVSVYEGEVVASNQHGTLALVAGERAQLTEDAAPHSAADATVSAEEPTEAMNSQAARRQELLTAIRAARQRRLTIETEREPTLVPGHNEPPPAPPGDIAPAEEPDTQRYTGSLGREYIREAIREVIPLVRECYELALDDDPSLTGRLQVNFVIGGEPEVGGVIEEAEIAERSTISHPTLRECLRETIYTLELPAPEGGGQVRVSYPFLFTSGDKNGSGEGTQGGAPREP